MGAQVSECRSLLREGELEWLTTLGGNTWGVGMSEVGGTSFAQI